MKLFTTITFFVTLILTSVNLSGQQIDHNYLPPIKTRSKEATAAHFDRTQARQMQMMSVGVARQWLLDNPPEGYHHDITVTESGTGDPVLGFNMPPHGDEWFENLQWNWRTNNIGYYNINTQDPLGNDYIYHPVEVWSAPKTTMQLAKNEANEFKDDWIEWAENNAPQGYTYDGLVNLTGYPSTETGGYHVWTWEFNIRWVSDGTSGGNNGGNNQGNQGGGN